MLAAFYILFDNNQDDNFREVGEKENCCLLSSPVFFKFFLVFLFLCCLCFICRRFVPKSWQTGERRSHVKKPVDR